MNPTVFVKLSTVNRLQVFQAAGLLLLALVPIFFPVGAGSQLGYFFEYPGKMREVIKPCLRCYFRVG